MTSKKLTEEPLKRRRFMKTAVGLCILPLFQSNYLDDISYEQTGLPMMLCLQLIDEACNSPYRVMKYGIAMMAFIPYQ